MQVGLSLEPPYSFSLPRGTLEEVMKITHEEKTIPGYVTGVKIMHLVKEKRKERELLREFVDTYPVRGRLYRIGLGLRNRLLDAIAI